MDKGELYSLLSRELDVDNLGPRQLFLATNWYMEHLVEGQFIDSSLFKRLTISSRSKNPISVRVSSVTGEIKEIRFSGIRLLEMMKAEDRRIKEQIVLAIIVAAEHLSVSLLMSLGNYINRDILEFAKDKSMYAYNGSLYDCVMKEFLNYQEPVYGIVYIETALDRRSEFNLLKNINNSCFMDSLLIALIVSSVNPIREAMFNFNTETYDYTRMDGATLESRHYPIECTTAWAKSLKDGEFNSYATLTQRLLKRYAYSIVYGTNVYRLHCTNLRKLLHRCNDSIPISAQASPLEVYSVLTGMYPKLGNMRYSAMVKKKVDGKTKRREKTTDMFTFADFLIDPEEIGTTILWDEITHPFLVFHNGMLPPMKRYGKSGNERMIVMETVLDVWKSREFNEYILDGKYLLAAAIMHHGRVSMSGSSGGHYTAYIRPYNDSERWYHYDDIGPSFMRQTKFPKEHILNDNGGLRPEIYIYERVL